MDMYEVFAQNPLLAILRNVPKEITLNYAGAILRGGVKVFEVALNSPDALEQITLLDVYRAVECVEDGQLFHFHEDPNVLCPVGRNIHGILDQKLEAVQAAMEAELKKTTLNDLVENAYRRIGQN